MRDNIGMETFADRLFLLMERRGLTQVQLSEKTGIPQSTISLWKSRGSMPKVDDAIIVADILGVSVEYLAFGRDKTSDLADRLYKLNRSQIAVVKAVIEAFEKQN